MKTTITPLRCAFLALSCDPLCAQAQDAQFKRFDKNGDGKLTQGEFPIR